MMPSETTTHSPHTAKLLNKSPLTTNVDESTEKRQNYFQFRSAEYQRQIGHSNNPAFFISKKAQLIDQRQHPGRFYSQRRNPMERKRDFVQEYSRYRDANYQGYAKSAIAPDYRFPIPCYTQLNQRTENEYCRYRDAQSARARSTPRMNFTPKIHYAARTPKYDSEAQRFPVPDNRVLWTIDFPDYKPVEYTTKKILNNPKADSPDPSQVKKFNQIDNKIDRRSFTGRYLIDPQTKRPRNPVGRTGMTGRGRLYHWGPNHAGDPVVTRWRRDANGAVVLRRRNPEDRLKQVLEFVAIQRRDTKQWAVPGGMVDPGEAISETVRREFQEEAGEKQIDQTVIQRLFSNGLKLYESYVDDPRNTDNAWMETVAMHFHDETGQLTRDLNLNAGDDAEKVVWCPVDRTLELYACHKEFLEAAVRRLDAFW